jgi:radical SAM protein with 4Fe4S-binding SPASM domain
MEISASAPKLHTLHFNVTNTCNLSCSFCYIDAVKAKTTSIPLKRIQELAIEARAVGGVRVIISGGEAFIRKDWPETFFAFADQDFAVSIVSNGTLLSHNVIAQLKTIPKLSILVSLDGDAESHNTIRGAKNAHRRTIAGLKRLREAGINVQVNATIIKTNLQDVPYLTQLSRDLDVSLRFSLLNPYNGRGTDMVSTALDVHQVLALREFCHEVRLLGSRVFINLPPLLQYPADIVPIRSPSCGWTKSYCGVTYDGNVTICGVAGADESLYVGNIMEQSFADIWLTAPLFNELRSLSHDDLTGICSRCTYRADCGGACRLSAYKGSGDFTASYSMCQAFYDAGVVDETFLDSDSSVKSTSKRRYLPIEAVNGRGKRVISALS